MRRIRFKPVDAADLPMLHAWLREPHVRKWWGDPDHQLGLIRGAYDTGEVDAHIAFVEGEPVAYIQSWTPSAYDDEPWAKDLTPNTPGIDIFIGPPDKIGKGLAAPILRAFAAKLLAKGASRIVIDPDACNTRAVRAYTKAGFRAYGEWKD